MERWKKKPTSYIIYQSIQLEFRGLQVIKAANFHSFRDTQSGNHTWQWIMTHVQCRLLYDS